MVKRAWILAAAAFGVVSLVLGYVSVVMGSLLGIATMALGLAVVASAYFLERRRVELEREKERPTVVHLDISRVTLVSGRWYAFQLDGRRLYATVYLNPDTGYVELTEVPNPYGDTA